VEARLRVPQGALTTPGYAVDGLLQQVKAAPIEGVAIDFVIGRGCNHKIIVPVADENIIPDRRPVADLLEQSMASIVFETIILNEGVLIVDVNPEAMAVAVVNMVVSHYEARRHDPFRLARGPTVFATWPAAKAQLIVVIALDSLDGPKVGSGSS
jgi:hypothetical protein